MQFIAVSRGCEMLSLQVQDLFFTGDSIDSPIVGVVPITKNRKSSYTYFRFTKQVDISICGFSALQGWLCVLRAHNVVEGNLFIQLVSNKLQGGTLFDGSSYGRALREMGDGCGVYGLAEHSARRGGAGYNYFVLRRDIFVV